MPSVDNNIVQSLMRILDCYFAEYHESELTKITPEMIEEFEPSVEPLFVFALTWSIGATSTLEGREKFSQKLRTIMTDKVNFPAEGMVYDFMWNKTKREWIIWTDTVPEYSVDSKIGYTEIVVPTFDSIRM